MVIGSVCSKNGLNVSIRGRVRNSEKFLDRHMSIHSKVQPAGISNSREIEKCLTCYAFFNGRWHTYIDYCVCLRVFVELLSRLSWKQGLMSSIAYWKNNNMIWRIHKILNELFQVEVIYKFYFFWGIFYFLLLLSQTFLPLYFQL